MTIFNVLRYSRNGSNYEEFIKILPLEVTELWIKKIQNYIFDNLEYVSNYENIHSMVHTAEAYYGGQIDINVVDESAHQFTKNTVRNPNPSGESVIEANIVTTICALCEYSETKSYHDFIIESIELQSFINLLVCYPTQLNEQLMINDTILEFDTMLTDILINLEP